MKSKLRSPHIGLSAYRLNPNQDNPREVAFAEQWSKEQAEGRVLGHLIGNDFTVRDATVAATVIQWLGSNVGMSFLEDVIRSEPKISQYLTQRVGEALRKARNMTPPLRKTSQ